MTEQTPPKTPPDEKKEESWIEWLAQKSAGLPQTDTSTQTPKQDPGPSPWRFAGIGIQFAATIALFAWMGYKIDRWRGGDSNGVLITLVLVAIVGNLYLLIKEAIKANK